MKRLSITWIVAALVACTPTPGQETRIRTSSGIASEPNVVPTSAIPQWRGLPNVDALPAHTVFKPETRPANLSPVTEYLGYDFLYQDTVPSSLFRSYGFPFEIGFFPVYWLPSNYDRRRVSAKYSSDEPHTAPSYLNTNIRNYRSIVIIHDGPPDKSFSDFGELGGWYEVNIRLAIWKENDWDHVLELNGRYYGDLLGRTQPHTRHEFRYRNTPISALRIRGDREQEMLLVFHPINLPGDDRLYYAMHRLGPIEIPPESANTLERFVQLLSDLDTLEPQHAQPDFDPLAWGRAEGIVKSSNP